MNYSNFIVLVIISAWGFVGCQSSQNLTADEPENSSVNYRLIYVIHGDANYLYHDKNGNSLQADEQKMAEAKKVGLNAKKGEVFIFHQKPERKILWLFPKKDRLFLHYRNGRLVSRRKYSPQSSRETLVAESELFWSHKSKRHAREFLLYFGHQIPPKTLRSYHRSRSDAVFNAEIFAEGIRSFLDEDHQFELTVLSTCDNGTPRMAHLMQPLSQYLLASPQNLHLSHIDTDPLLDLEQYPGNSPRKIAQDLAQKTYDRLSKFIQTAVTLSVYNLQSNGSYVNSLTKAYSDYQSQSKGKFEQENIDCAQLPFWNSEYFSESTTVLFKPAVFGRRAGQETHSGWGCQPLAD